MPPADVELTVCGPLSVCHSCNAAMTLRSLLAWAVDNDLGDLDGLAVLQHPGLKDTYLQLTGSSLDQEVA